MGKCQGKLPDTVGRVRIEIETWRRVRKKRSPMPSRLWKAAIALAETHGVYRISQALQINYDSLKKRVHRESQECLTESDESSGFVELGSVGFIHPASQSNVEVEMSKPDGSRMSIRVSGVENVAIASMIEDFWERLR